MPFSGLMENIIKKMYDKHNNTECAHIEEFMVGCMAMCNCGVCFCTISKIDTKSFRVHDKFEIQRDR